MSNIVPSNNLNLSQWFTPVEDPEITASVLSNTSAPVYESSPHRQANTAKSPYFVWTAPSRDKQKDANPLPEISEPIVGLRGFILHYGTRLSLFDGDNKKQICSSVSSIIGFGSDRQPIVNTNSYPISAPIYNGRGFSNAGEPVIANSIIETLKVKGSRGLTCVDCVLRGEDEISIIPESGPKQGQEQVHKCGASNKIIFCVFEFAIVEPNDNGKNSVVWYAPDKYLSRKGAAIIKGPFILEVNFGRAQATKRIGKNLAIITEPNSSVPGDAVTWISYLNYLTNPNNRKVSIVKASDPSAFNCSHMFLVNTATEIWCGSATTEYQNNMIAGWPVFRDWEVDTQQEFYNIVQTSFGVYDSERANVDSLSFFSPEEAETTKLPATPAAPVIIAAVPT